MSKIVWHETKMTANNAPSPLVASANTEFSSTTQAWNAFNGKEDTYGWASTSARPDNWIKIQFGTEIEVDRVRIRSSGNATSTDPKSIEIKAKENGKDIVLYTGTQSAWSYRETREFIFDRKYKITEATFNVVATGSSAYVAIGQILFGIEASINKTLILHDGEYKKWIQKMYGQSETTTAVPIMTSNNLPSGLAESSSYYSNDTRYLPFRAFNGTTGDANNAWISSTASNEWISYEFPSPVVINKYAIAPNPILNKSEPKSFRFEGYDGTKWVVLDNRDDVTVWAANVYNTFETYNNNAYTKYRLFVLSNNGFATYVSMSDIKLFKQTTPSILTSSWQTVSTTLPTVTQFLEQEMDNLSPLLDRNVTELEPMTMVDKSEILGDGEIGKLFSNIIDLKKYFDIRSVRMEEK